KEVETIPDPQYATTEKELETIEDRLHDIRIPVQCHAEWSETRPGKKIAYWKQDIKALRHAIRKAEKWYQKLLHDGKEVLDNLRAPDLPGRARKVLDEARTPPVPEKNLERVLPNARTVNYSAVFNFASVVEIRGEWEEMKKKLERYTS